MKKVLAAEGVEIPKNLGDAHGTSVACPFHDDTLCTAGMVMSDEKLEEINKKRDVLYEQLKQANSKVRRTAANKAVHLTRIYRASFRSKLTAELGWAGRDATSARRGGSC